MKSLLTGVAGQDSPPRADLLLGKRCEVLGLVRQASAYNRRGLDEVRSDSQLGETRLSRQPADPGRGAAQPGTKPALPR
jgi:GDP-D-mannose dehydratase